METMTEKQFLNDIRNHSMTVKRDDGPYRHLVFRQPENSWNMWFEIVTWPNHLTINGDMGTWSFSRIDDMFEFFRKGLDDDHLRINEQYWAEKITAESRFGGPSKKFTPEVFKASVLSSLDNYDLTKKQKAAIKDEIQHGVSWDDGDESYTRRQLNDFELDGFSFSDLWEMDGRAYTYHFVWCLYAIVWAIQQYDNTAQPVLESQT